MKTTRSFAQTVWLQSSAALVFAIFAACSSNSDSDSDADDTGAKDSGPCAPTTCLEQNVECGDIVDGCGGVLNCGSCDQGESCGGGGQLNVCGTSEASISLVVTPSRSSGVAPLAVFFDATETEGLDGEDFLGAHFSWDFGDANAGVWSTTGGSRNEATGYLAAHVFETPGTYDVTVAVIDRLGRAGTPTKMTITVEDPELVYAGTGTRCVSQSGEFTDCPTGAETVSSSDLSAQVAWVNGAPHRRLLFRRGESWSNAIAHFSGTGPNTVGAFGAGTYPVFVGAPEEELTCSIYVSGKDWRLMDFELDASHLPSHPNPGSNGMGFAGAEILGARLYIHHAGSTGFGAGGDYNYFYESRVEDNEYFSSYVDGVGMALLGSRIDQLRIATSFLRPAESSDVVVSHNLIDANRERPTCGIKWHSRRGVITDNVITAGGYRFSSGDSGDGWDHPVNQNLGVVLLERNIMRPSGELENDQYISTGFDINNSHMVIRNNLLLDMNIAFQSNADTSPDIVDDIRILNNSVYLSAEAIGLNIGNGDMFSLYSETINWEIRNNLIHSENGPGTTCNGYCFLGHFASTEGLAFSNNLYYKPSMTILFEVDGEQYTFVEWQSLGLDTDSLVSDPLLASTDPQNPSFLKPQPGSPAIDSGSCTAAFTDYARTSRPQGAACDIGAYEIVP